jgi:hypothetical protein
MSVEKYIKFIFFIMFFFLFSCIKENKCICFKTTGKNIKKEILLSDFYEIQINNIFNVFITEDTINKIVIEGGKNLVPFIKVDNQSHSLSISDKNKCNWLRSYKRNLNLFISVKPSKLNSIIINGECNIFSTNTINGNELNIIVYSGIAKMDLSVDNQVTRLTVHAATGDYILKGNTTFAYIYSFGTCYIFANKLISDIVYITNKSSGNDYVYANNEIEGEIAYIGNIYYSGDPDKIIIKQSSSGRLIKQ